MRPIATSAHPARCLTGRRRRRGASGPYRGADLRSSRSCWRASSSIRYGYIVFTLARTTSGTRGRAEGPRARVGRAGSSACRCECASLSSPRSVAVAVSGCVYEPGLLRGLFCEERYELPPARGVTQRCMPGGISLHGQPSHEGVTGCLGAVSGDQAELPGPCDGLGAVGGTEL